MTLVAAATCPAFAVMVSDRLVTLQRPGGAYAGAHDPLANKTVIFMSLDAVLVFGFAGSAYLDGIPTDEWIAQTLWGAPFQRNPDGSLPTALRTKRAGPRGLNRVLLALRKGLAKTAGGEGVHIMAAGWRSRRYRQIPVLIRFSGSDRGLASPAMAMRPPTSRNLVEEQIGVALTPQAADAANDEVRAPPTNAETFAAYVVSILTSAIRHISATDRTVGPHVMAVTVPRPRQLRITCRFDGQAIHRARRGGRADGDGAPVAFTPWVVSDFGYNSAMVLSGLTSMQIKMREWTIDYAGCPPPSEDAGLAFVVDQRRPPKPGSSAQTAEPRGREQRLGGVQLGAILIGGEGPTSPRTSGR